MTIEKRIEQCIFSLGRLNQLRVNLEEDGLHPKDVLFDLIAEKSWRLVFVWEIYAFLLPDNRYEIGEPLYYVPRQDIRTIAIDEVLAFENPDYRFYMRNNKHLFNGN